MHYNTAPIQPRGFCSTFLQLIWQITTNKTWNLFKFEAINILLSVLHAAKLYEILTSMLSRMYEKAYVKEPIAARSR